MRDIDYSKDVYTVRAKISKNSTILNAPSVCEAAEQFCRHSVPFSDNFEEHPMSVLAVRLINSGEDEVYVTVRAEMVRRFKATIK